MSYQHCARYFVYFLMVTSGISSASTKALSFPIVTKNGNSNENSCSSRQKKELMNSIHKNVMRDSRVLQTAIDLILCAFDTPQNTRKITNFIDNVVTGIYEGTGEEKVVERATAKTEIAKYIMAKGRAWSTTLQFSDDEVTLQYFSNEACVESVKLRHSENSWLVYEIGGACD
ncbi:hypothetical protein IM543_01175 [Massilia sp. UMI-21]|nr:hypothetical protein IM543_01175 [Massilia sp. UMI-21]